MGPISLSVSAGEILFVRDQVEGEGAGRGQAVDDPHGCVSSFHLFLICGFTHLIISCCKYDTVPLPNALYCMLPGIDLWINQG